MNSLIFKGFHFFAYSQNYKIVTSILSQTFLPFPQATVYLYVALFQHVETTIYSLFFGCTRFNHPIHTIIMLHTAFHIYLISLRDYVVIYIAISSLFMAEYSIVWLCQSCVHSGCSWDVRIILLWLPNFAVSFEIRNHDSSIFPFQNCLDQ